MFNVFCDLGSQLTQLDALGGKRVKDCAALDRTILGVGVGHLLFRVVDPVIGARAKKSIVDPQGWNALQSSSNTSSLFSGEMNLENDISFIFPT